MKIKTIYLLDKNGFDEIIRSWAEGKNILVEVVENDENEILTKIDGLVVFHENHNFTKEVSELIEFISSNNKPSHKVDVNGTIAATSSNFKMWTERNQTKKVLILGGAEMSSNPNLSRFLDHL